MFEFEVDFSPLAEVPTAVREAFRGHADALGKVEAECLLMWEEHCTECAMPACYKTCDLYQPRNDGKCRRFVGGITRIEDSAVAGGYFVHIDFKRWGGLMATDHIRMVPTALASEAAARCERAERRARAIRDDAISVLGRRGLSSRLARRYKRRQVERANRQALELVPSHFVVEMYNPQQDAVDLSLSVRAQSGEKNRMPWQHRLTVTPGYHRAMIDYADIAPHVAPEEAHFISVLPADADAVSSVQMYFGRMGFYRLGREAQAAKTVKVVAWDLDNTLWDGILVESEPDSLQLRPGVRDIIETLDRRGIVSSIISKNDHEPAMAELQRHGIDHLFAFPKISWEPKSQAMAALIADFNIGADTIVFIDDSPFEREEVAAQHPQVRVVDEDAYTGFLDRPEFNPPQSSESAGRRQFYLDQARRKSAANDAGDDYLEFLRGCEIRLRIAAGTVERVDRIHELAQRTNQMNFSGNRYSREQLEALLSDPAHACFALDCSDRFGEYGTVGFAVVRVADRTLVDLAFSCRVQSKRVEHAFLIWLIERYLPEGDFTALYRRTERNAPAGRVFEDLGFDSAGSDDGRDRLVFAAGREVPRQDLIEVVSGDE